MKPKLLIVTGNPIKFKELSSELNNFFSCEQGILKGYNEIQGKADDIILHKLHAAYEYFKAPVLVDDTSLHFDELGGFPGPYVRDFLTHMSSYQMGMKFAGSRVSVGCRLGLYDGKGEPIIATGLVHGDVVTPKNIDPGPAEFDLFVKVDGTDRPMLELSTEDKNKISHRGLAMKNLIEILKN
ncbi:MAG: non-canonical purine NTP pyrophosphatase [bacterium]